MASKSARPLTDLRPPTRAAEILSYTPPFSARFADRQPDTARHTGIAPLLRQNPQAALVKIPAQRAPASFAHIQNSPKTAQAKRIASLFPASGKSPIQRYRENADGYKISEHDRAVWIGNQELFATPDLIQSGNAQLATAGPQGSLIRLNPGAARTLEGRRMRAVVPELDRDAYNRRVATQRGIGYHQNMNAINRAGAARGLTSSETEARDMLRGMPAEPEAADMAPLGRHMETTGVRVDQIVNADVPADRDITPDARLGLPADCRRAAEAVTGTQTGMGYDERAVEVRTGAAAREVRGRSALPLPANTPVNAASSTHGLSSQMITSSIGPFLISVNYDAASWDIDRFAVLVGPDAVLPVQHLHDNLGYAWKAYASLTALGRNQFAAWTQSNQHANPEVGEAYTTVTEYGIPGFDEGQQADGQARVPWPFHWGGVIMKDGEDNITLENYSTGDEADTNRGWQFDMYGTQTEAQTFHARHMATHQHGNIGTTLRVQNRLAPANLRAFLASVAELQHGIGSAGFAAQNGRVAALQGPLNATYGAAVAATPAYLRALFQDAIAQIADADARNTAVRAARQRAQALRTRHQQLPDDVAGRDNAIAALGTVTAFVEEDHLTNRPQGDFATLTQHLDTWEARLNTSETAARPANLRGYMDLIPGLEAAIGTAGFAGLRAAAEAERDGLAGIYGDAAAPAPTVANNRFYTQTTAAIVRCVDANTRAMTLRGRRQAASQQFEALPDESPRRGPVTLRAQTLQTEWTRIPHSQRQPADWALLNQLMDQVEHALAHDPAP